MFYYNLMTEQTHCLCGNHISFEQCCNPYLTNQSFPKTAEALMRSRYSAFVVRNATYIQETMRDPALTHFNQEHISESTLHWIKLDVMDTSLGSESDFEGYVTFRAYYKNEDGNNAIFYLEEKSFFKKVEDRWYYVDGDVKLPVEVEG